jgi:succinate dehydrogenase/fumarate reductase flavoprotein subunit
MAAIFGSEIHRVKADVVVIGGGTAGLNTALAAAELGADVLVVDKAPSPEASITSLPI